MLKRAFDIVASAAGLLILSPIFAIIAILIRLDSPGPVLFRQGRVGRFGRVFQIYKFRSIRAEPSGNDPLVTASGDARVTRIGGFLRQTKVDELPQLMNVLAGDMSLVGPRPEVPRYA